MSTSYVLIETYALLARRLGLAAAREFRLEFEPLLDVVWVDRRLHEVGLDLLLGRAKRHLSLVDAVSLVTMRSRQIGSVFGFEALRTGRLRTAVGR